MSALTKAYHDVSNNGSVAELLSWEWTDEKSRLEQRSVVYVTCDVMNFPRSVDFLHSRLFTKAQECVCFLLKV